MVIDPGQLTFALMACAFRAAPIERVVIQHDSGVARYREHASLLGGWESSEMVRRYAHFSAEHLAPYADQLCALRVVDEACHGTNQAHPANEKGAS